MSIPKTSTGWQSRESYVPVSMLSHRSAHHPGPFVSGRYPQKTPVETNNIPLNDGVITFASLLKQQGYATGFAGKWHLDGDGKPQWSPERKFGFDDNRFMFNRGHWKNFEIVKAEPRVGARDKKGQPSYSLAEADERSFRQTFYVTER